MTNSTLHQDLIDPAKPSPKGSSRIEPIWSRPDHATIERSVWKKLNLFLSTIPKEPLDLAGLKEMMDLVTSLPNPLQGELVSLFLLNKNFTLAVALMDQKINPGPITSPSIQLLFVNRLPIFDATRGPKFKKDLAEVIGVSGLGPLFLAQASLLMHDLNQLAKDYDHSYRDRIIHSSPDEAWLDWIKSIAALPQKHLIDPVMKWDKGLTLSAEGEMLTRKKKPSSSPLCAMISSDGISYYNHGPKNLLTSCPHQDLRDRAWKSLSPAPSRGPHHTVAQDLRQRFFHLRRQPSPASAAHVVQEFWQQQKLCDSVFNKWTQSLAPLCLAAPSLSYSSIAQDINIFNEVFYSGGDLDEKGPSAHRALNDHPHIQSLTPSDKIDHAPGLWASHFYRFVFRNNPTVNILNDRREKIGTVSAHQYLTDLIHQGFIPQTSGSLQKTMWAHALLSQTRSVDEKKSKDQWIALLNKYQPLTSIDPVDQSTLWHSLMKTPHSVSELLKNLWKVPGFDDDFKPLINHQNKFGDTVLHLSAQSLNPKIVHKAVDLGADPSIKNLAGQTPLASIKSASAKSRAKIGQIANLLHEENLSGDPNDVLLVGCKTLSADLVEQAIQNGADLKTANPPPLIQALKNFSVWDPDESPDIIKAILARQEKIIQLLITHGADIHATDRTGRAPLHYATAKGFVPVVRQLLSAGADPNVTDKEGYAPYHVPSQFSPKSSQGQRAVDLVYEFLKCGLDLDRDEGTIRSSRSKSSVTIKPFFWLQNDPQVQQLIKAWADQFALQKVIDELGLNQDASNTPSVKKKKM